MKLNKKSRFSRILASAVLSSSILLYSSAALAQQPEYQGHIDWAAGDSGAPDCPERYVAVPVLATCLVAGNRSCITGIAVEAAYRNQDQLALYLMAEITQCHNSDARAVLYDAGPAAVGNYLRTAYDRPAWGPALDLAVLIAEAAG
jgi:hypothetical protein